MIVTNAIYIPSNITATYRITDYVPEGTSTDFEGPEMPPLLQMGISCTLTEPIEDSIFAMFNPQTFFSITIDKNNTKAPKNSLSANVKLPPILFDYLIMREYNVALYIPYINLTYDFNVLFGISNYSLKRMTPMGFYEGSITLEPWKGFFIMKDGEMVSEYFSENTSYTDGDIHVIDTISFQTITLVPYEET